MNVQGDRFPLAEGITAQLGHTDDSLFRGEPNELIERVTPTTAELLRWWFQQDYIAVRHSNFHVGQRDAILAIIYAHEVLGATSLLDLYEKVARDDVLLDGRLGEVTAEPNRHPKYAAKMATARARPGCSTPCWSGNTSMPWRRRPTRGSPGIS